MLDWALEAIRTRLIVRLDLAQNKGGKIDLAHLAILGAFEDDDGSDPYYLKYMINNGHAHPLEIDWRNLARGPAHSLFVEEKLSTWPNEWRCEAEAQFRLQVHDSPQGQARWERVTQPTIPMLEVLMRLRGALEQQLPLEDTRVRGNYTQAEKSLLSRHEGLVQQYLRPLQVLTTLTRGL